MKHPANRTPSPQPPPKEQKVLLCIDDHEEGLAIRKIFFEKFNYSVLTASSACSGLEILVSRPVNLVILDFRMPDICGEKLIAEVKRLRPRTPVILLSGYPSLIPAHIISSVDAFVRKGRPPRVLLAEVDRLCGCSRRRPKLNANAASVYQSWEAACQTAETRARALAQQAEEARIRERQKTEQLLRSTEKLAVAGRLSAAAVHDIRNPLEAICSALFLLEQEPGLSDDGRQYLDIARKELTRLTSISRKVLNLFRPTKQTATTLRAVLEEILELYCSKLAGKHIAVEKRYDSPLVLVRGDLDALHQAFSNLLVNAADALGRGGAIKLRVACRKDSEGKGVVRVLVADNGPGIAPEHRHKIFEPLFTTKGQTGTGLGLWITRRIVEEHGGSIRVRSSTTPGRSGTVFQVTLPSESADAYPNPC